MSTWRRPIAGLLAAVTLAVLWSVGVPPASMLAAASLAVPLVATQGRLPRAIVAPVVALALAGATGLVLLHGPALGVSLLAVPFVARRAPRAWGIAALLLGMILGGAALVAEPLAEGASLSELAPPLLVLAGASIAVYATPAPLRPAPAPSVGGLTPTPLPSRWFSRAGTTTASADPGDSVALAAGIAHDFNNLLTSILGNAHVALAELPEGTGTRRAVLEIEEAGRRAQELVAQLLAYSGTGRLDVRALPLESLLSQATLEARSHLPEGVALEVLHGDGPLVVEADPSHLRQAMLDLLVNAIDAMEGRKGRILVSSGAGELSRATLDAAILGERLEAGPYVWFEVQDQGAGIPDDVRPRIFEPFFTTKPEGTGLGLAALYGVVRDHLGAMQLETSPGEGTTLRVWLPSASEQEHRRTLPAPGDERLGEQTGTILVAEDEDLVRRAVTRMLSRLGFDVVATADGHDAIRAFTESPGEFRLVFLDVRMPNLDGFQVLEQMRELRPDVPAILCTGFAGAEARIQGRGIRFLRKPFSLATLVEVVNDALSETAEPNRAEP